MNRSQPHNVHAAARQHLETALLMGVDVVPIRRRATADQSDASDSADGTAASMVTVADDCPEQAAALTALYERYRSEAPHAAFAPEGVNIVFGEGHPNADLMFIGEAPGAEEDRTGRPFVGRAGQKLNEIIEAMGLAREQVYIANVLKTRPPDNRTPLPHEVAACAPFLEEQIRIIQPLVMVTLGGPATKLILNTNIGITRLRGTWAQWTDPVTGRVTPVMPTFHPAYLLRAYTRENRMKVWSDMKAVLDRLGPG